jgi:hypothetical protein
LDPADGDKADIADIAIRIIGDPEFKPREVKSERQPEQPAPRPQNNDPFIDPIELADPRVREWRETLRRAYPGKRHRPTPPTTDIEGVQSVGEILQKHPLLKQLISDGQQE